MQYLRFTFILTCILDVAILGIRPLEGFQFQGIPGCANTLVLPESEAVDRAAWPATGCEVLKAPPYTLCTSWLELRRDIILMPPNMEGNLFTASREITGMKQMESQRQRKLTVFVTYASCRTLI